IKKMPEKVKKTSESPLRINGHLGKGLALDTFRANCYQQVHIVKLSAGLEYSIDMRSTGASRPFDPYLRLEDTAGVKLAEDDDSGGGPGARVSLKDGTHTQPHRA